MHNRVGKTLQRFSMALVGVLSLVGCDRSAEQSSLKVTNAIEIDDSVFPAVVQLMSRIGDNSRFCSGFFVNEHQVLTAAHCVADLPQNQPRIYLLTETAAGSDLGAPAALRYTVHADYVPDQVKTPQAHDLAVVEFPAGVAAAAIRLSQRTPRVSDAVTLIGFGSDRNAVGTSSTQVGTDPGQKRYGQNSIKTAGDGILSVVGVNAAKTGIQKGQYVATAQGDSGGPVLLNSEVVAVIIAGELRQGANGQTSSVSYAIDLSTESNRNFLDSVLD